MKIELPAEGAVESVFLGDGNATGKRPRCLGRSPMWPFAKKEEQSVAKINEEEPKQPVTLQLKFDPVATQRWLDSKRAESDKKGPEPAPEVKLECPTCKQILEKFSYRRFKCPKCRSWIYFKGGCLVTKEERDKIQEEFYRKAKADELAEVGITEEMIQQRE